MADIINGGGSCRALMALAWLGALSLPAASRPMHLDPEEAMVEEFQSICAGYYPRAQCVGAIRFVLKTSGTDYFVQLHDEEVGTIFLEKLFAAVRGGEAVRASETAARKVGD